MNRCICKAEGRTRSARGSQAGVRVPPRGTEARSVSFTHPKVFAPPLFMFTKNYAYTFLTFMSIIDFIPSKKEDSAERDNFNFKRGYGMQNSLRPIALNQY